MSTNFHKPSKSLSNSTKHSLKNTHSKMYTRLNPSIKVELNKSTGDKNIKTLSKSLSTTNSGHIGKNTMKRKKILSIGSNNLTFIDVNKSSVLESYPTKVHTETSMSMNNNIHNNISFVTNTYNNIKYNNHSLNKSCCFSNNNNIHNSKSLSKKSEPHKIKPNYYFNDNKPKNETKNDITIPLSLFKDLEIKLTYKLSQNKTNSKSVKYNTTKSILEELIKYFPEEGKPLLLRLLKNYHEVVTAFLSENRKFQEQNELTTNKNLFLEKENITLNKRIKDLDIELEVLKKKIMPPSKEQLILFSKSTNETVVTSSGGKTLINIKEQHNNNNDRKIHINEINKLNLEDLDAIYFYDKVQMNEEGGEPVDIKGEVVPNLNLYNKMYK